MPPILIENLEVDDEGFSHVNIPRVRICFLWDNICPSLVLFNVTLMYELQQSWCRAQRVGFSQCWAGQVLSKKLGSGKFRSGRSVEIFDMVFPGTSSTLWYFHVLWVFQVFFWGGSEPNEYGVLCLKYPSMSRHTEYFGLPEISGLPRYTRNIW